jgi:glycosyltransferase involved in cell wall biosynthesis
MQSQFDGLQAIRDLAEMLPALGNAARRIDDLRSQIEGRAFTIRPPESLVGRQCNLSPPQWHLAQLLNVRATDVVRAEYHARWLAYLLEPDNPARYPSTSIIIPVYNRRRVALEAIESCFDQDCNVEIIVVDDGSTDDLEAALEPIRQRIVFHKQANRGACAARNAGLRLATGMYVRFLDSDDLLEPSATKQSIAAFGSIPDADVCISLSREYDPRGWGLVARLWEPDGRPTCPTTDLMRAELPALFSATTLSRWLAFSLPPFDEMLLKTHDVRYWFHIAVRGAKVIAVNEPLLERRRTSDSLTLDRREGTFNDEIVLMANIIDTMSLVDKWPYLLDLMGRFEDRNKWVRIASGTRSFIPQLRSDFLQAIANLSSVAKPVSVSELPALMSLLAAMCQLDARGHVPQDERAYYLETRQAIRSAIIGAPPISAYDVVLWTRRGVRSRFAEAFSLCATAPEIAESRSKCIDCFEFLHAVGTGASEPSVTARQPSSRKIWSASVNLIAGLSRKAPSKPEAAEQLLNRIVNVIGLPEAQSLLERVEELHILLKDSRPSAHYHLEQLRALSTQPPSFSMFIKRYLDAIHYHARWLAYFLTPQQLQNLPNVVAIIQLPNAPSEFHRHAVNSLLSQTYSAVDVVIVADLRNSEVQDFFANFEGKVTGLHQNKPTQATAFNLGITKYYPAELSVLFENIPTIDADFVKRQIEAFADNAARDVLVTSNTVTISRITIHRAGLMDEWLSFHALTRYFFRLSITGAREAAESCFPRLHRLSLTEDRKAHHVEIATVVFLNLADAIQNEGLWEWIPHCWEVLSLPEIFDVVAMFDDKYLRRAYEELLQSFEQKDSVVPFTPLVLNFLGLASVRTKQSAGHDCLEFLAIERKLLQAAQREAKLEVDIRDWIMKKKLHQAPAWSHAVISALSGIPASEKFTAMREGLQLLKDQMSVA